MELEINDLVEFESRNDGILQGFVVEKCPEISSYPNFYTIYVPLIHSKYTVYGSKIIQKLDEEILIEF